MGGAAQSEQCPPTQNIQMSDGSVSSYKIGGGMGTMEGVGNGPDSGGGPIYGDGDSGMDASPLPGGGPFPGNAEGLHGKGLHAPRGVPEGDDPGFSACTQLPSPLGLTASGSGLCGALSLDAGAL